MTNQASGDGFAVDPARLDGVAGQLGRCYDDFSAAAGEFAGGGPAQVLGDVRDAWTGFDNAWTNELLTTKTALAELIGKVSSTADTYRDTEYQTEKLIRNLFAGLFR